MASKLNRFILVSLFWIISSTSIAFAQEGMSVNAGWGYFPYSSEFMHIGHPYGPDDSKISSPGSLFCGLDFVRKSWLTSSVLMDVGYVKNDLYTGDSIQHYTYTMLSFMHMWRFTYLIQENWSLYSSAGIGLTLGIKKRYGQHLKWLPIIQLVPIGVSYGKKYYVFGETGIGISLVGVRLGVGYRFD